MTGAGESSLNEPPRILFVDDSPLVSPAELADAFSRFGVVTRLRHPEEAILSDLQWADLVVVDYFLSSWRERDEVESVARSPYDGLAAAAAMRSALLPALAERRPGVVPSRSVAFVLWSSNLKEATFNLPDVVLPHVFSRENNLEWAFKREDLLQTTGGEQMAELANAVTALPPRWPSEPGEAETALLEMLGLENVARADEPWMRDAAVDVVSCRPPMHELSERSHGLALIRWLLHRILPYPCFLIDELHLCARLRVDALGGGEAADGRSLIEVLAPFRYSGALQTFDGLRWWRAGIEDWLFSVTDGQSGNSRLVAEIAVRYGAIQRREWLRPVVVIDGDLVRSSEFSEVEHTVRVQPDDWPVYADDAYALRAVVADDPGLRALVEPGDRYLLDAPAVQAT